jgi:hypothetical protein
MSSPLRRRQVFRESILEFPSKRLAGLKNMVPDRGRGTAQNVRDLGCLEAFHLPQNEGAALLGSQKPDKLPQDSISFLALRPQSGSFTVPHKA